MTRASGVLFAATIVLSLLPLQGHVAAAGPDCKGHWFWNYTTDLPDHFWAVGPHTYQMRAAIDGVITFTPAPVTFTITPSAPLYEGLVQLRFFAARALSNGAVISISEIHPGQTTIFQWGDDLVGTKAEAKAFARSETIQVTWDGGPWVEIPRGPLKSFCKFDQIGSFKARDGENDEDDD